MEKPFDLFFQNQFILHKYCYFCQLYIIGSYAIFDIIIAITYFLIPILWLNIYRKRNDFGFNRMAVLFAISIFGIGIIHLLEVVTLWRPVYYLNSGFRIITALASLGAVVALFKNSPQILRSSLQWGQGNKQLQDEITELKEKDKAIHLEINKRIDQLHLAQKLSKVGSFETNHLARVFTATPQLLEIFGLPLSWAETPIGIHFFYDKLHPDDFNKIKDIAGRSVSHLEPYEFEYRIVLDGQIKHILVKADVFKDEQGTVWSRGAVMDITERKQNERKLEINNKELASNNEELSITMEELTTSHEQLTLVNQQLFTLQQELEERVEERTKDLQKTHHELQERNEELDQYVYKVSHDIRAPIASISGLIQLIKLEENKTINKDYLIMMENRIVKLDDFIRSVLSYSKILNTEAVSIPIDFRKIVSQCMEELTYYPDAEKLNVITEIITKEVYYGDELRLLIVFKNMISNAIKYRNKFTESYLQITIEIKENAAFISFKDNGIGIEEDYHDKIFQMFFRASIISDGSGLGLYIVRQAVDRMKGSLMLHSEVDKGTIFSFTLPDLRK